jgi:lipoyl-dependent peroxiredoxin
MEWHLVSDRGSFTVGDAIKGDYSYKSRFEDGPGSNPEQLIAAAHAACFSMALAKADHRAESIRTEAAVTLRPVDGALTITNISLVTIGDVPGIDDATFREFAENAKANCPVSRALAGVPDITVSTLLAS